MNAKERAVEIYNHHLALASTDGRSFRKTVMDQLMEETGCTLAAAATHYNNAKKANPVEGLGRAETPKGVRRASGGKGKDKDLQADNECFTVVELLRNENSIIVGRCQSFLLQGDASETYDAKIEAWPRSSWRLLQGLGPISGESYRLQVGEAEIKQYDPKKADGEADVIAAPVVVEEEIDDEDDEEEALFVNDNPVMPFQD